MYLPVFGETRSPTDLAAVAIAIGAMVAVTVDRRIAPPTAAPERRV